MTFATPLDLIAPVTDLVGKFIDRMWPDKTAQESERAKAVMALEALRQDGEFRVLQQQLSAILAEANSSDPWTSRARPSFLYIIYVMILAGIPMGFLSAFRPEVATAVASGMQMWLAAIPEELYMLFGVGYLGYTGSRGWEKVRGKANG